MEVITEANYIREKARAEIEEKAVVKISDVVGSTSIMIEPTQIKNNTIDLIELKATTLITIDATTVNITGL